MENLKIYCVQNDIAWLEPDENFSRVDALLEKAAPARDSLVILPEMFATGFSMDSEAACSHAEMIREYLSKLAGRLGCYVAAGVAEGGNSTPLNRCLLYGPDGKISGEYNKIKLFTFAAEQCSYAPGEDIANWHVNGWSISPFICYDLRFPELQRRAISTGVELLIFCANWPAARREHWLAILRARAIENLCYVAAVNRCGRDPDNSYAGDSIIFGPQGEVLAAAGANPCVIQAELETTPLQNYRDQFPALKDMRL